MLLPVTDIIKVLTTLRAESYFDLKFDSHK